MLLRRLSRAQRSTRRLPPSTSRIGTALHRTPAATQIMRYQRRACQAFARSGCAAPAAERPRTPPGPRTTRGAAAAGRAPRRPCARAPTPRQLRVNKTQRQVKPRCAPALMCPRYESWIGMPGCMQAVEALGSMCASLHALSEQQQCTAWVQCVVSHCHFVSSGHHKNKKTLHGLRAGSQAHRDAAG